MTTFLTNAIKQVGQSNKSDDDFVDRLNHRFTVIILVSFIGFLSANQFVGNPISCWAPSHFSATQITYTNTICWLKGGYYLESNQLTIPHRHENSQFRVNFYQYIPYLFIVLALLFYLPHKFWRFFSKRFGFDLRRLIEELKDVTKTADDNKLDAIVLEIDAAIRCSEWKKSADGKFSKYHFVRFFQSSRRFGHQLTLCYITMKILYVINCFVQFYLLSHFLSFSFYTFGYDWLSETIEKLENRTNSENYDSKWFPRVVMCDFMVRHLGSNQHWMAIQCSLPVNLFNEIIFLIFWTWLVFLTVLSCFSLIFYIVTISMKIERKSFRNYLRVRNPTLNEQNEDEKRFLVDYLQMDGTLVLQILAQNTNDVVMSKLVLAIYQKYNNSPMNVDRSN